MHLHNTVLRILAQANRQEKKVKGIHTEKEEVKPPLSVDAMILYIENPKESTKNLLELTSLAVCQDISSRCKNQLNFYTIEQSKNVIKPTISVTLNVNKSNNPIESQKWSDFIKKHDPTIEDIL